MAVGLWRPVVTHCLGELFGRRILIKNVIDVPVSNKAERFGELMPETAENPISLYFDVVGFSKREKRVLEKLMPDCCDGECGSYRNGHPAYFAGVFNGINWELTPIGTKWQWVKEYHHHNRGGGLFEGCGLPHRRCVVFFTLHTWGPEHGAE